MQDKIILLIEDNPDDIELTKRALKKSHIYNELIVLRDGAEAIDYFFGEGSHSRILPQLILLDLKLPKISGSVILQRLRSEDRTKLVPIVILTSSDEALDIETSYDLKANSYVQKPIDFAQFTKVIQHLGLFWLVVNQPPPNKGL